MPLKEEPSSRGNVGERVQNFKELKWTIQVYKFLALNSLES